MTHHIAIFLWAILGGVVISALTYSLIPSLGRRLRSRGIVGNDLHKQEKPAIAERGGIALLASFPAFMALVFILTGDITVLYALGVTLAFGLYGLWDDIKQAGKYQKLAVTMAISLGALALAGPPALLAVPLLILLMGASNVFNMFAGFNGLEIGCSGIVAFFFSLSCLLLNMMEPFALSFGAFLILMAFLAHNKYPAKIFPGNVGTMLIGGFFASMALYYGLFLVLVPLLSLYILDIMLKGYSAGYFSRSEKIPTKINMDGTLASGGDYLSLTRLILRFRSLTEKRLVSLVWKLEIAVGSATVLLLAVVVV